MGRGLSINMPLSLFAELSRVEFLPEFFSNLTQKPAQFFRSVANPLVSVAASGYVINPYRFAPWSWSLKRRGRQKGVLDVIQLCQIY